ncbi:unnamed protein product [Cylindrotheca closterium]|uniref:Uncharacterized protein n=1 Tax=Cylindrotheca closterium TaxID=2856 RepID=A0AAD2CNL1_9STRA|nr:unnamed protein product [Cylindrotheca closterium]
MKDNRLQQHQQDSRRKEQTAQHEQLKGHRSRPNSLLDQDEIPRNSSFDARALNRRSGEVELLNVVSPDASKKGDPDYFEASFDADFDDNFDDNNNGGVYYDPYHNSNRIPEEGNYFDSDDDEEHQRMFEPYHDPQTNRIIMRMRMGNLMDDESDLGYTDSSIVATEAVQDQSPAWALFDNPAFDKFSLFNKSKSKDELEADNDTPFDQVSFTDPYNAWDSLPTFLQTPYSFINQAKNNLSAKKKETSFRTSARQKMKQKMTMKETRINKQGFLEESTITTAASSSSTSSYPQEEKTSAAASSPSVSVKLHRSEKSKQEEPETLQEPVSGPFASLSHQHQTTTSSSSSSPKEDPPADSPANLSQDADDQPEQLIEKPPVPRRLSTERLESPFVKEPAEDIANGKHVELSSPRRLSKSLLESPFRKEPGMSPPESLKQEEESPTNQEGQGWDKGDGNNDETKQSPGRLGPGRLKSPFLEEDNTDDTSQNSPSHGKQSQSPQKCLSQSRIQSPFLQQDQQSSSPKPNRSSPPSSPLRPAIRTSINKASPKSHDSMARRKVSLSPPSTPILGKVSEIESQSKTNFDSVLDMYRSMIENKSVTSTEELEKIMTKEGYLSQQEIKCFVFALGIAMPGLASAPSPKSPSPLNSALRSTLSNDRRVKMSPSIKSSSTSDAGTATSGNSYSSQRLKARASSKSTGFDRNISNLMATIKKENAIPSRRSVRSDDDAKTSISVMSTQSCRELSIQRLRRRIASTKRNEKHEVDRLLQDLEDAQNRQKRLEQQLNKAGIMIAEDIPYAEAKAEVSKIAAKMQEIGSSQATHPDPKVQAKLRQDYFVLEQQMEKYMRALELTDEYLEEQERMEKAFDNDNKEENQRALEQVWKHMPVNIRQQSVEDWLATRSPSGKFIPKPFLLKFARTNILTLLRMQPDFVQRAHPSNLEQRRVTGLTITERRALQAYLFPTASKWRHAKDALTKRKWNWYCILRQTLKDHLLTYERHVTQYEQGSDGECSCDGFRCPIKANRKLDYFADDYGYPSNFAYPEYEKQIDPASCPQKKPASETAPKKPASSAAPSRNSLLSEISSGGPLKNKGKRVSLMADISAQRSKMRARPSSLMDEIAAKAAMRQANANS